MSMQEKIKEILSLPSEKGLPKYHEFLKELYECSVLWTVVPRDYCGIDTGSGHPVAITPQGSDVSAVRLFTEYRFAVDFCANREDYSYLGVPLILRLDKERHNFSSFFSIAPNMKVSRVWLDDCSIAQPFNFGLGDMISINNIDTRISGLCRADSVPTHLQFNEEWLDLFSCEMCSEFFNPMIDSFFSEHRQGVCEYMETRAPLIYVLFFTSWFSKLLDNPNWKREHPDEIVGAENAVAYATQVLIRRLNEMRLDSDMVYLLMLGEDNRLYDCGEATVGVVVNDIGLRRYTASVGKRVGCDVNVYNVTPGHFKDTVDMFARGGSIKYIRFFLPYNDNINVVVSLEEIYRILGG